MRTDVTFQRILNRGTLPDSDGGLYNPTVWTDPDGTERMLVRREADYTWKRPSYPTVIDPQGRQHTTLIPHGFKENARIEDCRAFRWRDHVLASHVEYVVRARPISQRLSTIDGDRLVKWDDWTLPVPFQPVEKNWVLATDGDDLFCVYSLDPLIVCRRTADGTWALVHKHETGMTKAFGKPLHNSTHLVPFDDGYLGFWHYILDRSYVTGAYWLDRHFRFCRRTPILIDGSWVQEDVYKRGVCYISSAKIRNEQVTLFYGEGDAHSGVATFPAESLRDAFRVNEGPIHRIR